MPWTMFGRVTNDDLGAIYDYRRTGQPVENQGIPFTPKAERVASW